MKTFGIGAFAFEQHPLYRICAKVFISHVKVLNTNCNVFHLNHLYIAVFVLLNKAYAYERKNKAHQSPYD